MDNDNIINNPAPETTTTQEQPKVDPRDDKIKQVQDLCNRLGFLVKFKKCPSNFLSTNFEATIDLDNDFMFGATGCSDINHSLLYAGKLIKKLPDNKTVSYDLDLYGADAEWIKFVREWKIFKPQILERIQKRDILERLAKELNSMALKIDLKVSAPETKEEKYDWMMAIEEAHKMIMEGK